MHANLLDCFTHERARYGGLLSDAATERVVSVLGRLPLLFESLVIETRLQGPAQADVLVCISQEHDGRAQWQSAIASGQLDQPLLQAPLPTIQRWADGELAAVPLLWLEYDLLLDRDTFAPRLSACLHPDIPRSSGRAHLPPEAQAQLAQDALEPYLGRPLPASMLAGIQQCAAGLPAGRVLVHVGMAPLSEELRLRLAVHLPAIHLIGWLEQIGWPGDFAHARSLLEHGQHAMGMIGSQVELTADGLTPYLDLEIPISGPATRGSPQRALTRELQALPQIVPERVSAALCWPGLSRHPVPGTLVPRQVLRTLYFKLRFTSGALEAKAYLNYTPVWSS